MGILLLGQPPQFSQRSVINLDFVNNANTYAFINHLLQGNFQVSPVGSAFTGTDPLWPAVIDANGWPNSASANGKVWGGGIMIPDPSNFAGPYVMSWDGDGQGNIADLQDGAITFTDTGAGSGVTRLGNGSYVNSSQGSVAKVIVTVSASSGNKPRLLNMNCSATNSLGAANNYVKNFRFYRLADEPDLLAGNVFRAPFKQSLVNLNPSAVRFLNWTDGGSSMAECRFENRRLPTCASYSNGTNWPVSPSYPAVTGTNAYSVDTAIPTTANPKTTPVAFQHGEVAALLFTNGPVRCSSIGGINITAMTNANPCKVTLSGAHGYNTGDVIVHWGMNGMGRLAYFPVKITLDGTNPTTQYTIADATTSVGIDTTNTTNYPPYSGPGGGAAQYLSIDVKGPGNVSRGARPMAFKTGDDSAGAWGAPFSSNTYNSLYYDKNVAILSDGAGNLSYGAWMIQNNPGPSGMVPLEIMVKLVNELNTLAVSQYGSSTPPINMWLNIPHASLTSMDADYSTASDYALNAVDVCIDLPPAQRTALGLGVTQRAAGYFGLTAKASLLLELSNETWNTAQAAATYLSRQASLRWGAAIGGTNNVDMYILRSTLIMKALSGTARLKRVLGGWQIYGYSAGNINNLRINASVTPGQAGYFYLNDQITMNGGFGAPITQHDCFTIAYYFDADWAGYYDPTGVGSFTADSALYASGGSTNQNQALANFVAAVTNGTEGLGINTYLNNSRTGLTADLAAAMKAFGKSLIGYEGGPDWRTGIGGTLGHVHTITSADSAFLVAVLNSTQWRDAQVGYFNRTSQLQGSAMPAVFNYTGSAGNQRWAYCSPDSYASGTEGQALLNSPVWVGMGARNQALSP